MKRLINCILIICLTAYCGTDLTAQTQKAKENKTFKADEILNYEMGYGWITGGLAKIELKEELYQNKKVFHTRASGYTVGMADKLFFVYDVYESYFDTETGLPYKAIRNIRENKYKRYQEDFFDNEKKTVTNDKGITTVKEMTFDVASAVYYLRREKLETIKNGDIIQIHTYFHGDPWELIIRFKGYETLKTKFGKIECMKFKPVVEKGTFEDQDALSIWISKDDNHVPIRIQMDFFVGSFKTDLVSYSGLKNELKVVK